MKCIEKLLAIAEAEVGYCEKDNAQALDSMSVAGAKNYTKYARDVNALGLMGCQGQPWCGTYQFWLEYQAFGKETALQHLGPKFYNCFATRDWAKATSKWIDRTGTPKPGYRVIFSQSHIALVTKVTASKIYTNEGNTSDGSGVNRDGGRVCNKVYDRNYSKIIGYVTVEYTEKQPTKKSGWLQEDGGWRFYLGDTGECIRNDWYQDVGKWYWFNGAGLMISNDWYEYQGHCYYFGPDGAMATGLQGINGKWYYFDQKGRMATKPVTLVPDADGELQFPHAE